jgi:hypothetical protein
VTNLTEKIYLTSLERDRYASIPTPRRTRDARGKRTSPETFEQLSQIQQPDEQWQQPQQEEVFYDTESQTVDECRAKIMQYIQRERATLDKPIDRLVSDFAGFGYSRAEAKEMARKAKVQAAYPVKQSDIDSLLAAQRMRLPKVCN